MVHTIWKALALIESPDPVGVGEVVKVAVAGCVPIRHVRRGFGLLGASELLWGALTGLVAACPFFCGSFIDFSRSGCSGYLVSEEKPAYLFGLFRGGEAGTPTGFGGL